jgi:hypothetical protein
MSDQVSAVRARVEAAALEYHKATDGTGEGEYGCPGLSCPGVQRLANFWTPIVEAALRAVPLSAETEGLRDEELSRLRELMAKATPGPWARGILEEGCIAGQGGAGKVVVRDTNHGSMPNKADSDLIIAMRNALPRLLAAPTVAQAPQRKPDVFDEIEENR